MLYVKYDPHATDPTYTDENFMDAIDVLFERQVKRINEEPSSDMGFIELTITNPVHLAYFVQDAVAVILSKRIKENRIILNFFDENGRIVSKLIGAFRVDI